MLASPADNHSPVGESNVIGTPVSSLHSSLMTSGDDQSTLLGRRSCQGFRSLLFGFHSGFSALTLLAWQQ